MLRVAGGPTSVGTRRLALADDVLTSGGHLRACAAKLLQRGHRVDAALVAGRADQTQVADLEDRLLGLFSIEAPSIIIDDQSGMP